MFNFQTPRTLSSGIFLFCVSLLFSAQGLAQPNRDDEARGIYLAGVAAFDAGRFEEALHYFEQSYGISPKPRMLYNIGTAADRVREDDKALNAFERYLAEVPDADNRAEVEGRVRSLRSALERRRAIPETVAPAQPPAAAVVEPPTVATLPAVDSTSSAPLLPESQPIVATAAEPAMVRAPRESVTEPQEQSSGGLSIGGVVLTSVGGASVAAGTVLLVLAQESYTAVEDAKVGTRFSVVAHDYDRAPAFGTAGLVALSVGVAATVGGVVWMLLGSSSEEPTPGDSQLAFRVGPTSLELTGSF